MAGRTRVLALSGLLLTVPLSGQSGAISDEVGAIWLRAVADEGAVAEGLDAITARRGWVAGDPASPASLLLDSYEGSFLALRARHGGAPRARLRDLRAGFDAMDAAVAAAPSMPELRYIRLMSGFCLPAVFGRRALVRDDLAVLARLLPTHGDAFPPALLPEVVTFVLEHGRLAPGDRATLESVLAEAQTHRGVGEGGT